MLNGFGNCDNLVLAVNILLPGNVAHCHCLFFFLEKKVEVKTEDDPEPAADRQDNHTTQPEQVKVEADKGGHYSRKRPYEENRSYGYYEHREEKRYVHHKNLASSWCSKSATQYNT